MRFTTFLKRVLLLDAASCLAMGAMLAIGAEALAPSFGLDAKLITGAGIALLPIGAFILWLGTRTAAPAALVYLVIAGNLLWTLESFLLIGNAEGITAIGTAFVAVQALAVVTLTGLEWIGVGKSRAVAI